MTVIDAWAALTEGYLPTNHQLTTFIARDSALFQFPDLSPSGTKFADDVAELRQLLISLITKRNGDEQVQNLVWRLRLAAAHRAQSGTDSDPGRTQVAGKRPKDDDGPASSSEALRHLSTVARILLVQPQIRYVLSDAVAVLAQIVAVTAEETIPIAQGQMEQVPSEAPVINLAHDSTAATTGSTTLDSVAALHSPLPSRAVGANGLPRITPEIVDAVVKDPNLKLSVPLTSSTVVDVAQMAAVARTTRLNPKGKVASAGTAKKIGRDLVTNAHNVWDTDGQFRVLERLRKLCVDLQRSKGWPEAATFFLNEGESALKKAADGIERTQQKSSRLESETYETLLDLLENFGGPGSVRAILQRLQTVLHKAKDDAAAQEFFARLNTLVRRALLEEAFALSKEAEEDATRLRAALGMLDRDLREELVSLLAQVVDFALAVAQDEYLNTLVKKLHETLISFAKTSDGSWGLNADLWSDVTLIVIPTLISRLGVLPIPRIMYSHPDFDFVVENVVFELHNLVPKYLDVRMTNDVHIDFEKIKSTAHSHVLKVKVRGMSLRIHHFAFAFLWKKGIKFHDHGIADLTIGGFGLSITIEIPRQRKGHYFYVRKCKAKLEDLKFHIRKSNHRILHAVTSGVTNSYLTRKILCLIIGRGIGLGLKQLDLALMKAHLERERQRRLGTVQKTEISLDEIRSRAATIRDLLRKYHESAGTFRIDFDPSEDPENKHGWEDAHAVKWIKDTLEKTGAEDVRVWDWRTTAFGGDDPDLLEHGEQREDGHAARMAAKLQQLASEAAAAATRAKATGANNGQELDQVSVPIQQPATSNAADEVAIQRADHDLSALQKRVANGERQEAATIPLIRKDKGEPALGEASDGLDEPEQSLDKTTP